MEDVSTDELIDYLKCLIEDERFCCAKITKINWNEIKIKFRECD